MREEIDIIAVNDEVELYVEDVGPVDAPPIVVLHGGPGGSDYVLREGLEEELGDFRVIYFDQRGGGRSPALEAQPRLFTVDALVEDLEALREHLEIEQWGLLAHGFGAIPALEYARRLAPNVLSLGLIAPWVSFPALAKRLFRASLALRDLPAAPAPEDPMLALSEAFRLLEPKAIFDALMFPSEHGRMEYEWLSEGAGILGNDAPGQMFVYNGLWELDYAPHLLELRVQPVVMVGSLDGTSYPEQAETVADLSGGSLEVIEGAGHYPWIDQPAALAQALQRFLEQLEA